ncbi:CAP domain-containing protein [Pseudobacteriovorax antillogorgiicola]|uniref:Cysteine-rich secretory protein family protein n=1 Tax=Pseudobacteriovorax antillogorgiicola TaxID=1513793 RepID=A0A1Y6B9D4_9BACT|nr:CAP domain-containing protein [Pseudobacteriovorax antillogorgiicola]TCS57541.1 cysteine-rich secretory family protein [Pseudobacteriovorax antillogorgiicola]SME99911.1 Cysteine-rich secretory protein family protein [Pseudobacteriovorax antillogorgiicola]
MKPYLTLTLLSLIVACGSNNGPSNDEAPDGTAPQADLVESKNCESVTCQAEAEVLRALNQKRTELGLAPLSWSEELSYGARVWSDQQASASQISHDGFPERRLHSIQSMYPDFEEFLSAENVAMTYSSSAEGLAIGQQFFQMWWNSKGHQQNMLGNHSSIGVGIVAKGNGYYGTQLFFY